MIFMLLPPWVGPLDVNSCGARAYFRTCLRKTSDGLASQRSWLRQQERFPITWNHVIEKESLKIKEVEHVLIEKVEQLFRDML